MNNLEKQVLQLIGENVDDPDVFTDDDTGLAQIRASLNDAIQEVCAVTGSYTRVFLLPLFANRQFYRISPLQDYFGYVVSAWDRARAKWLEPVSLAAMSNLDAGFLENNGEPDFFGQIGDRHIFIAPYSSSGGKVLELTAAMIPKAYARDTDKIKVGENFKEAVVHYAVSEYYASTGNASRATEYFSQYLELSGLESMKPESAEQVYQMQSKFYRGVRQ